MAVVFAGVLLASFCIEKALSPAGELAAGIVDQRKATLSGIIEASGTAHQDLVLRAGDTIYSLANPVAARPFLGRRVWVTGTLHDASRTFRIDGIDISGLDHTAKAP